jgi:GntR family transcriptional regulator
MGGAMNNELNKPLYVQIQEYIAELILSGKLAPESKIPSERDFSVDLEVSRMTVRRAITELVNEGLLERRHGSGTYVAKPKVTFEETELVDTVQAMRNRNLSTTSQLLEFGEIATSRRLAEKLEIEIGRPLYRVVILRLANRVPVLLERVFFPCSRCPNLEEYDLEKTNIYDLLTAGYHAELTRVSQTIEAIPASETVADQLRVEDDFPLLMVTRIVYQAQNGKPILYSQDFLRSDYARIHSEINL